MVENTKLHKNELDFVGLILYILWMNAMMRAKEKNAPASRNDWRN